MTEVEKYCEMYDIPLTTNVINLWDAAQRAVLRTISDPPVIPSVGDEIKFLGLCHPSLCGQKRKVVAIEKGTIEVYYLTTQHGDNSSSGVLSEVEIV